MISQTKRADASTGFSSLTTASLLGSSKLAWVECQHVRFPFEMGGILGEQKRKATNESVRARAHAVSAIALPDRATRSMLEGLATLHSFVLAADAQRRVVWLKDEFNLLQSHPSNLIGRPVDAVIAELRPDDAEACSKAATRFSKEMKETGRVSGLRFDLDQDGDTHPLEISAFAIRDGDHDEIVVCLADRRETRERLEQKNEELETCLRGVSHDLRSPLVAMLGFSRLLRDDYQHVLAGSGLHFVDRIEQAGRHMEQLLHDMLELSRIGESPQHPVAVHPMPILEQIHSELKLRLEEDDIELRLPENPPTLVCDRTRLYQLFSNLIGNAVQHGTLDTKSRIDVEIESVVDGWQISVTDDGPGIAAEDRDRIFDLFETAGRADPHKRQSGLGLAIVKKIVESHSGRVWVEEAPGRGARFVVWLPAR